MSMTSSPSSSQPDSADGAAFESNDSEILERLRRVMGHIVPAWLADQRDDLVQLAMMRVMEIARSREQSATFTSSYLWRVAQSVLIDEIRRRRRRPEVELDAVAEKATTGADPERSASSKQLGAEVWDCLGRLHESRRRVVTLHLSGHSPAEAATLLGFDNKKVYNLIHRGLQGLRDCLRQKGLAP